MDDTIMYKEALPQDTLARLRGILAALGVGPRERWKARRKT